MTIRAWILGVSFLGFLVTGCQKANFLHYERDRLPPPKLYRSYKIKELQGTSRADILWVIDNSGSMSAHQTAVIKNTQLFMQSLSKGKSLDYKIGLISTFLGEAPFVGFTPGDLLTSRSSNPIRSFEDAVARLGTFKGCPELTFKPLIKTLTDFPNFTRRDAVLSIISVTDTMEETLDDAKEFLKLATRLKGGDLRKVLWYGVYADSDSLGCRTSEPAWDYPKSPFEFVIKATKGKVYPLCSRDFGKNLADITQEIKKQMSNTRLVLSRRPIPESIRLSYRGKNLPGGAPTDGGLWYYDYDQNAVVFYNLDFAPSEDELVDVTFTQAI